MPGRPLLRYEAAAAYTGLSVRRLRRLVTTEQIPVVKFSDARSAVVWLDPDDLDRFISRHKIPARAS